MEKISTQENNEVSIIEASFSDVQTLIELEKSVANTHLYSPMLEVDEWGEELRKGKTYIIKKNGVVAGNFSYETKSDDHIYISGMVISPTFQRQGIAREVLATFLKKYNSVQRVDLVTHPDNVSALKLYQSLGFVIENRVENYFGDGEPRLVLALLKEYPA